MLFLYVLSLDLDKRQTVVFLIIVASQNISISLAHAETGKGEDIFKVLMVLRTVLGKIQKSVSYVLSNLNKMQLSLCMYVKQ